MRTLLRVMYGLTTLILTSCATQIGEDQTARPLDIGERMFDAAPNLVTYDLSSVDEFIVPNVRIEIDGPLGEKGVGLETDIRPGNSVSDAYLTVAGFRLLAEWQTESASKLTVDLQSPPGFALLARSPDLAGQDDAFRWIEDETLVFEMPAGGMRRVGIDGIAIPVDAVKESAYVPQEPTEAEAVYIRGGQYALRFRPEQTIEQPFFLIQLPNIETAGRYVIDSNLAGSAVHIYRLREESGSRTLETLNDHPEPGDVILLVDSEYQPLSTDLSTYLTILYDPDEAYYTEDQLRYLSVFHRAIQLVVESSFSDYEVHWYEGRGYLREEDIPTNEDVVVSTFYYQMSDRTPRGPEAYPNEPRLRTPRCGRRTPRGSRRRRD